MQPVTLTRRELYDLIWSKPMLKLAEEFGISDRGLAKICERHRVTGPSRGYWAKLAAGKRVKQSIFVEVNDPVLNRIVIAPSMSSIPEAARTLVEEIRAQRKERKAAPHIPDISPSIAIEPVGHPHQAIAATARTLRKAKPDTYGGTSAIGEGLCGITVHRDRAERAISFLHSLATGLEAQGLELLADGAHEDRDRC